MPVRQWEAAMVEVGRFPGAGRVAGTAIGAILAVVVILLGMTGVTIGRSPLVNAIDMATGTICLGVCSGQFEGGGIMVESSRKPAIGCVTSRAAGAELAVVRIVLRMAGITSGGGALENTVGVATGTGHLDMLAGQFKRGRIVVES
jgi:hypothetical protein